MSGLPKEPKSSEITPPELYARREVLKKAGLFTVTAGAWGSGLFVLSSRGSADPPPAPPPTPEAPMGTPEDDNPWKRITKETRYDTTEAKTDYASITTYNNYYELGLGKVEAAKMAGKMRLSPWTVKVEGEVKKEQVLDLDWMLRTFGLEERVYRMRCVEAWSMVIPWVGFPLAKLVSHVEPTSRAKFVELKTLFDPAQLPNQSTDILPWPYVEGLRLDEAMNPLTLLAVGIYGAPMLGQNGAPLRLVVPWKYGFKNIKSIVSIRFTETQPKNTWAVAQDEEYGFYANVNPEVDHPRWSQASERRIGVPGRIPTLMFNGYGEHVAHLYSGMDLRVYF